MLKHAFHLLCVGDEVGRNVATVKLHTFHNIYGSLGNLGFFDCDYAFLLNLCHSVGDEFADFGVVVGRNAGNSLNLGIVVVNLLRIGFEGFYNLCNSLVDTTFEVGGVGTGSNVFHTNAYNCLSQNSGGSCAVACDVVGLGGNFLHQLCAHIHKWVVEFDFLCNGNAVLCNLRCAVLLLNHHVAALRSESGLYCVCKFVNALFEQIPCFDIVFYIFCHDFFVEMSILMMLD